MELHEIRYFLALSETLNFTRAAEQCNVTQPALTRAIKSLELKLGGQLVRRERGNSHLTELGRLMKPYFVETFGRLEEARRRAQDFVQLSASTLRVGMMCTIGPALLIDLFADFHRHFDGVELYLKDGPAKMLEELLLNGELDVALLCEAETANEQLHALPLYREKFLVAVAEGHPLAALREVGVYDLDGHTYLSRVNCEFRDTIREYRESRGIRVRLAYQSERDDWVQCMVRAGLGFTIVPEYAVTLHDLATRPFVEPAVERQIKLVTVRGRPHAPAVGAFVHASKRYPWAEKLKALVPKQQPIDAAA